MTTAVMTAMSLLSFSSRSSLCRSLSFRQLHISYGGARRYSVREYLQEFRKSDRKRDESSRLTKAGSSVRDWEAKNSIIITWQISFDHIRQIRPSAADLLSLMSFFDRQGIS